MLPYNKKLKSIAGKLRKNMTAAEQKLWQKIKGKQLENFQFYRQKIIGNYIVDFYCPKAALVIELDGGQHYTEEAKNRDNMRDEYLKKTGLKVLRYTDTEMLNNTGQVLEDILRRIQ